MCNCQEQKEQKTVAVPVEEYAELQEKARILRELFNQQMTEHESFRKDSSVRNG